MRFADQPHHDGSILYVSNLSPTLGETVTLWVRVPRMAGISTVHVRALRDGEQYFSQAVIDPDRTRLLTDAPLRAVSGYGSGDTWWRATVVAGNPVTPYRFLLGCEGEPPLWLTAKGVADHDVSDASDFRLVTYDPPPGWTDAAVVYEIFPDRFAQSGASAGQNDSGLPTWAIPCSWDQDTVNDSGPETPRQFFGGDLDGIIEHLDHIQALGANTIYLRPFFPAGSNHRYDASSFDVVDPLLGGDAALKRLSGAVHARGMRLVGDLTTNHCGNLHEWFIAASADPLSPERQMFYFDQDGGYESFYDVPSMPRLNWGSPLVRQRMGAVAQRWMGVLDGWRIDVAQMTGRHRDDDFTHDVARYLRRQMTEVSPGAALVAEHLGDATADLDADGWQGTMNCAGFLRPVWTWLRGPDIEQPSNHGKAQFLGVPGPIPRRDGVAVLATMREFSSRMSWRTLTHSWQLVDSFDTPRARTITGSAQAQLVALGLQATLPGTPMICAGSEFGLTGRNGEDARTPMPWNRPRDQDETTLTAHRTLMNLRSTSAPLNRGGLRWLHAGTDALAFIRETHQESVLVLARRDAGDAITLPMDVPLVSLYGATDLATADGHVTLPAGGKGLSIWRTARTP